MASIAKRPNGRWRARYRDEAEKEHSRHFDRKADAQRWLDTVTAAVVRGDYVDPKAGRVTVRQYAGAWEAVQVSSEGTRRIIDNALRLHLLPSLGDYRIAAVRPTVVQGFVKELESKGLSAGTVRNIYAITAQVFAAAVDDRVIPSSPCRRIRLPKDHDDEVEIPTVDQVSAVAAAIGDEWQALVITLAGSGLRVGELLGLEVGDVDFLRRTVKVERQRMQSGDLSPLKSKASRRVVPLGQVVIDELAAYLATRPHDGPLFVDELGGPLQYWRWKKLLAAATATAGVSVTSHGFRHFFASAQIAGGASVKQVQTLLGHASAVVTLRTYTHLWPGDEDRSRDLMDAALGPLADSLRTEATSKV